MLGPDQLDTPLVTAFAPGWSGVNNRLKPSQIGNDEFAALLNMRLGEDGRPRLRPGTGWLCQAVVKAVRGLFYADTPNIETVLKWAGGKLYQVPGSENGTPATQIEGVSTVLDARVQAAQLVDRVYFVDGNRLQSVHYDGEWKVTQLGAFYDGSPMPRFRTICESGFRLFAAGGVGVDQDTIYVCGTMNGQLWLRAAGVRVGRGQGDPIIALKPGPKNSVFALKEGSAWQVMPTGSIADWTVEPISHQRGCIAAATAVNVGQDLIFLTRDGVVSLSRLVGNAPVTPMDLLSAPVASTMKRVNWATARRTACAELWGDFYMLALPLDGANDNNAVLVFNTRTQRWSDLWTGWVPQVFVGTKFGGVEATLFGGADGSLVRIDESVTVDATGAGTAAEIIGSVLGRAETFGAPDLRKQPFMIEVEFRESTAVVDLQARLDGSEAVLVRADYVTTPNAGAVSRRLIENARALPPCRELQVQIDSQGGPFAVSEIHVKALPMRASWDPPAPELLAPLSIGASGTISASTGPDVPVSWPGYTLQGIERDDCVSAATWTLAQARLAGSVTDSLENAAAYVLTAPRRAGSAEDALSTATGWTLGPDVLPPVTPPEVPEVTDPFQPVPPPLPPTAEAELRLAMDSALADGADLYNIANIETDWSAASAFLDAIAFWLNSRGPFTRESYATPPPIRRWFTLRPRWFGEGFGPGDGLLMRYDASELGGKGALITESGSPEGVLDRAFQITTPAIWNPNEAWTLFIVAKNLNPLSATQRRLYSFGDSTGPLGGVGQFAVLAGKTGEGIQLEFPDQGVLTFSSALSTSGYQILEIHKAASATISGYSLVVDGTTATPSATTGGGVTPSWLPFTGRHLVGSGFSNVTGAGHRGRVAEIIRLNTNSSTPRAAARTYLATKFGITLP